MPKLRRVLPVLLGLLSQVAAAQQVVVLQLQGDTRGVVRAQLLNALTAAKEVELVPLKAFAAAAAKQGFRADRLATDAAVKAAAPELGVDAVVAGEIASGRLFVQILDASGTGLWSRELPLVKGRLAEDNAKRLASAISVAATPAPPAAPPETVETKDVDPVQPALPPEAAPAVAAPPPAAAPGPVETPTAAGSDEVARPRLVTGFLTGSTTWRGYCARPGVNSCNAYDAMDGGTRPIGETVTFTSQLPYAGYALGLEVFPLAHADGGWRNVGVFGRFGQAWSSSSVRVQTTGTSTEPRTIVSADYAWQAELGYRHHFLFGANRQVGYLGGRLGLRGHDFVPEAGTLFGASRRRFPTLGVEGALPLLRRVRAEAGASFFLNPRPGDDELERYGSRVSAVGFAAFLGASGDVCGPLGYFARLQYEGYSDSFTGAGALWSGGGVSQELYVTLSWGLSATY